VIWELDVAFVLSNEKRKTIDHFCSSILSGFIVDNTWSKITPVRKALQDFPKVFLKVRENS